MFTSLRWSAIALLIISSVMLIWLVCISREVDLEAVLILRFQPRHSDTFDGIEIIRPFMVVHVLFAMMIVTALMTNRFITAAVVFASPVIIEAIYLATSDLSDPSWHNIIAIATIGEIAGFVGGVVAFGFETPRFREQIALTNDQQPSSPP